MEQITGSSNRILEINLTDKTSSIITVSENDRRNYLGGKGLGLKLIYDRMRPGVDPLGSENILALMTGVIMGTNAPCSGRFSGVTKSPLTGIMVASSCGGSFGMALKTSGWDGCLISGSSKKPVYLVIDSSGVKFKPADKLWGKDTQKTQKLLEKEGKGALVIGPAGENLVRFANACSDQRFLGRGGIGAVMGSKNLKAVVALGGEFKIIPVNREKFDKARKKATAYINRNYVSSDLYRKLGTNANMKLNRTAGLMTVNNFSRGDHPDAPNLFGETIAANHITGHHTCKPCTILCGHKGTFGGKETTVPEYETSGLLGSNLGIFDPVAVSRLNDICTEMGIDTISAGGTIAWAMEAGEKGLFASKLKFGSFDDAARALKDIALTRGIGRELAMGSRWLSAKYGGADFAIQVKGLEMAAYDPRGSWGQALSYAVANRGACHLSSSAFTVERYFSMIQPFTGRSKASMVKFLEDTFAGVNSIHTCQFTAFPYELEPALVKLTPKPVLRLFMTLLAAVAMRLMDISLWPELWSSVTGHQLGITSFLKAGARIHLLERHMNCREGIAAKDDTLPDRFLFEQRSEDAGRGTIPLSEMLRRYYFVRGYDENGIPKKSALARFGIPAAGKKGV